MDDQRNMTLADEFADLNRRIPEYLAREHADIDIKANAFIAQFAGLPHSCDTDEMEREMTDLGGRLQKFLLSVENQRKDDKRTPAEAPKIVDDFFKKLVGTLPQRMDNLRLWVNTYKDAKAKAERERIADEQRRVREAAAEAERQRQEAERAERERAEAARKAAEDNDEEAAQQARDASQRATEAALAAKQAEHDRQRAIDAARPAVTATVRSDSGVTSTQGLRWTGDIEDLEILDLNELKPYLKRADIEVAVRQYATKNQDTKPLAGVRIYQKSSTSFRS